MVAAAVMATVVSCGGGTEPSAEVEVEAGIEYDLTGTIDSSMSSSFMQTTASYRYDTSRVARPLTGLLHFDSLTSKPAGSISMQDSHDGSALQEFESLTAGGATFDGSALSITYGPYGYHVNAEIVLIGIVAGDSIYGTIRYGTFTSTTSKKWGRFVARRR